MDKRVLKSLSCLRTAAFLFLFVNFALADQGVSIPFAQGDDLAAHRVAAIDLSQITVAQAALRVLTNAHVPAGVIILSECANEPLFDFHIPDTTLANALNAIMASDHTYRWEVMFGAIAVFPKSGIPDLLQATVQALDSRRKPETIGALTSNLLTLPEIKAKLMELKLLPAMKTIVKGMQPHPNKIAVELYKSSLLQVLNSLAVANGQAVWQYQEFECRNPREYQLDWIRD